MASVWSKVAKSKRWPSTKTLATMSPPPPARGVLWQPAQELASGADSRLKLRGNSKGSVGSDSGVPTPLDCGRPPPSWPVQTAPKSSRPWAMTCCWLITNSSPSRRCSATATSWPICARTPTGHRIAQQATVTTQLVLLMTLFPPSADHSPRFDHASAKRAFALRCARTSRAGPTQARTKRDIHCRLLRELRSGAVPPLLPCGTVSETNFERWRRRHPKGRD